MHGKCEDVSSLGGGTGSCSPKCDSVVDVSSDSDADVKGGGERRRWHELESLLDVDKPSQLNAKLWTDVRDFCKQRHMFFISNLDPSLEREMDKVDPDADIYLCDFAIVSEDFPADVSHCEPMPEADDCVIMGLATLPLKGGGSRQGFLVFNVHERWSIYKCGQHKADGIQFGFTITIEDNEATPPPAPRKGRGKRRTPTPVERKWHVYLDMRRCLPIYRDSYDESKRVFGVVVDALEAVEKLRDAKEEGGAAQDDDVILLDAEDDVPYDEAQFQNDVADFSMDSVVENRLLVEFAHSWDKTSEEDRREDNTFPFLWLHQPFIKEIINNVTERSVGGVDQDGWQGIMDKFPEYFDEPGRRQLEKAFNAAQRSREKGARRPYTSRKVGAKRVLQVKQDRSADDVCVNELSTLVSTTINEICSGLIVANRGYNSSTSTSRDDDEDKPAAVNGKGDSPPPTMCDVTVQVEPMNRDVVPVCGDAPAVPNGVRHNMNGLKRRTISGMRCHMLDTILTRSNAHCVVGQFVASEYKVDNKYCAFYVTAVNANGSSLHAIPLMPLRQTGAFSEAAPFGVLVAANRAKCIKVPMSAVRGYINVERGWGTSVRFDDWRHMTEEAFMDEYQKRKRSDDRLFLDGVYDSEQPSVYHDGALFDMMFGGALPVDGCFVCAQNPLGNGHGLASVHKIASLSEDGRTFTIDWGGGRKDTFTKGCACLLVTKAWQNAHGVNWVGGEYSTDELSRLVDKWTLRHEGETVEIDRWTKHFISNNDVDQSTVLSRPPQTLLDVGIVTEMRRCDCGPERGKGGCPCASVPAKLRANQHRRSTGVLLKVRPLLRPQQVPSATVPWTIHACDENELFLAPKRLSVWMPAEQLTGRAHVRPFAPPAAEANSSDWQRPVQLDAFQWCSEGPHRFSVRRATDDIRDWTNASSQPKAAGYQWRPLNDVECGVLKGAWADCPPWPKLPSGEDKLRCLDLFSGAGGMSLGFAMSGLTDAERGWAVEWLPCKVDTYKKNFPHHVAFCTGVGSFVKACKDGVRCDDNGQPYPRLGDVDIILGGPPCQGFSGLNSARNTENSSKKREHSLRFVAAAVVLRPKYVVMENVRGVTRPMGADNPIGAMVALSMALVNAGYQVAFQQLQASEAGVPQNRRRAFMVAAAPGVPLPHFPMRMHAASYINDPHVAEPLTIGRAALAHKFYLPHYATLEERLNGEPSRTDKFIAPYRGRTVVDAIWDLEAALDGDGPIDEPIDRNAKVDVHRRDKPNQRPPTSFYQFLMRRGRGTATLDPAQAVTSHHHRPLSGTDRLRIAHVPSYDVAPCADWRWMPNIVPEGGDRHSVCHKLKYYGRAEVHREQKDKRAICDCMDVSQQRHNGSRKPAKAQCNTKGASERGYDSKGTLIPWCLPHTSETKSQWAGLIGRSYVHCGFDTIVTTNNLINKQGRVLHPKLCRILTVRECARGQGFPDHFDFVYTNTQNYNPNNALEAVGNAVPPPLAESIGRCFVRAIGQARRRRDSELLVYDA